MNGVPEYARQAADDYRKMLRKMKALGIKVEDVSDDVAASWLALHQNALMVIAVDRLAQTDEELLR